MKAIHYLLIIAVFTSFMGGYFFNEWIYTMESSQTKHDPAIDASSSIEQIDSQLESSNLINREDPLMSGKSGNAIDQGLKDTAKYETRETSDEAHADGYGPGDEDLEAVDEIYSDWNESEDEDFDPMNPHELPFNDEQTMAALEVEQRVVHEDLADSMRNNDVPEEEIMEQVEALATLPDAEQAEPPHEALSIEDTMVELEFSLLEADVPQEDIDDMIQELVSNAEPSQETLPPNVQGENQMPDVLSHPGLPGNLDP